MKKIKGESEDRLKIYVNGIPDLTAMPKDEFNIRRFLGKTGLELTTYRFCSIRRLLFHNNF